MIYNIDWTGVAFSLLAIVLCFWAYRMHRRSGYLILAAYFLLGILSATVITTINRVKYKSWVGVYGLSAQASEAYSQDELALKKKYFPSGIPSPPYLYIPSTVSGILLITGLWLLARLQPGQKSEPTGGGNAVASTDSGTAIIKENQ